VYLLVVSGSYLQYHDKCPTLYCENTMVITDFMNVTNQSLVFGSITSILQQIPKECFMLPFFEKKLQDDRLVVNGTLSQHDTARLKVEQDIAFLSGRITAMKAHPRPNNLLIEHYQSMLKSRESVLKWLLDGCDDEASGPTDQRET